MINIKSGTQTWSSSPQRADFKSDNAQSVSAADKAKYFDSEAVGDTLNKISDPNYVDNAKKMRTVGNNELGKDAFMTLLLTQMKNQDPTNPLKSHEMAAQLAQFTSLEKLNNINEGIDNLRKDNQPGHNFQALAMIGKTINMDNSKIAHVEENESHELRFALPQDATKANIEIKDATGATIRKMELKNLKSGPNKISWNGKTEDGTTAGKGDYILSVEAFASNNRKLFVQTRADGRVTGVNFTASGPQLMIGKQAISMADVKSISDSGPSSEGQDLNSANALLGQPHGDVVSLPSVRPPAQPLTVPMPAAPPAEPDNTPKPMQVKPETKDNSAKRAKLSGGTVNDAAMAQGLINDLNKNGAKAGMSGS